MTAAEQAVKLTEEPLSKPQAELSAHRVYLVNQKVEIARAKATANYAEDQLKRLSREREEARLKVRADEVGRAKRRETDLQKQREVLKTGSIITSGHKRVGRIAMFCPSLIKLASKSE